MQHLLGGAVLPRMGENRVRSGVNEGQVDELSHIRPGRRLDKRTMQIEASVATDPQRNHEHSITLPEALSEGFRIAVFRTMNLRAADLGSPLRISHQQPHRVAPRLEPTGHNPAHTT